MATKQKTVAQKVVNYLSGVSRSKTVAQIAAGTKTNPSTVRREIQDLALAGLVTFVGVKYTGGKGRPAKLYIA